MRYFRRIGEYRVPNQKFLNEQADLFRKKRNEALITGNHALLLVANGGMNMVKNDTPTRGIEHWTFTNVFMEMTKDQYEEIVVLEKEILSRESHKKAGIKHWHWPVKTDAEDCDSFLMSLIGENNVEIWTSSKLDKQREIKTTQMEELIEKVIEWGEPKGLTEYKPMLKSWPQYEKTQEEVNEIGHAIAHGSRPKLIDGIGDSVVTLILLATQNGLTLQECVEHAYSEIKDRTGKTENGKFIKDGI